jgi:hypothetical protein
MFIVIYHFSVIPIISNFSVINYKIIRHLLIYGDSMKFSYGAKLW